MRVKLINELKNILKNAGDFLLKQDIQINSHKTLNDLLTENDLLVEEYIISNIKNKFPFVNIVSEETSSTNSLNGISVVIDPIDGTCNYANELDLFGIQVAVFEESILIGSVIYFPLKEEVVYAIKGKGVFINDKKIVLNKSKKAKDSILLISDYYSNIDIDLDKQFELVKKLQSKFLKTRHLGAACIDFLTLAKSQAVAYITYYHYIWDIAPGLLICEELGCVYKHISGKDYEFSTPGLVISNSQENLDLILNTFRSL